MALPDSVCLKIGRAKEHIEALRAELNRYFNTIPCHIAIDIDCEGDTVVGRLVIETPIPDRVTLIIGDCLQNLRTALDYLIWELVLKAQNVPGKQHAFPVCVKPESFNGAVRGGRLDGIPQGARAIVERLQPYADPGGIEWSVILALDELTNINKHRRVLVTVLNPFLTTDPVVGTVKDGEVVRLPFVSEPQTQATIRMNAGQMEVDAYATVNIAFDEGGIQGCEVVSILERITNAIELEILPLFEIFF